jgi:hypothetical protein
VSVLPLQVTFSAIGRTYSINSMLVTCNVTLAAYAVKYLIMTFRSVHSNGSLWTLY